MKLDIVRKIACERTNSSLVTAEPRNPIQGLRLKKLYELLIVLRIILTLNIQTGWIHQDEFTNSLEVITGDYFDLQVYKSPAFNSTFPTRSIVFLHVAVYVPFILTHRFLSYVHPTVTDESVPNPEVLILVPRLVQVLLSFLVDYILIWFCSIQKRKPRRKIPAEDDLELDGKVKDEQPSFDHYSTRLITLASSSVILVFATRTHSSLLNLILFGILLCLVSESMHRMEEYSTILNEFHAIDPKKEVREKVIRLKELRAFRYNPIENLHWIAIVVICGLFNDPEFFISYASVPIFFYLQRGISNPHIGMTHFHIRLFVFLVYFFGFSIPFVLWDSFYHGRVTLSDFSTLNLSISSFVVAPVNYFVTKASSVRDLETIPWIFISFLLLFNILGILGLLSISKEFYDMCFKDWKAKPRLDSQWTFLNCSWFLPLILLIQYKSTFDLVPLMFPLVVMHGHKIPLVSRFSWKMGLTWFACNFLGVCFWGYLNQGGVLGSFLDLHAVISPHRFNETHVDILLSQLSAIPPIFVLSIPSKWKTIVASPHVIPELDTPSTPIEKYVQALPKTVLKLELDSKVRVFHIGVSPLPLCHFEGEMLRIFHKKDPESLKINFVLLPRAADLEGSRLNCFRKSKLTLVKTYWNHFQLSWSFFEESFGAGISRKVHKVNDLIPSFSQGLNLYRFEDLRYPVINEPEFHNLFSFTSNDSFTSYAAQSILFLFASFLFLMSFLTVVL